MKFRLAPLFVTSLVLSVGIGSAIVSRQPKSILLHTGWQIQPAGEQQIVGDHLAGGLRSPNGKWILIVAVGQGTHMAYTLSAETGKVVGTCPLPKAWIGLGWSDDSRHAYVSGGTSNLIHSLAVDESGGLTKENAITLGSLSSTRQWLAGMVVEGTTAWVLANSSDRLLKVDLTNGAILGTVTFEPESAPYQVRRARDGRLLVSLQGRAQVVAVDPDQLKVVDTWSTGRHPNDILVAGERAFVACGNEDEVLVIDLHDGSIEERIRIRPWADAPAGSTPHALAVSGDGKQLYVAISDDNAVAAVDISQRGHSQVTGFIPSGAYPSALAMLNDGKHLVVGAGKGTLHGPNGNTDKINPDYPAGYPYIVTLLKGLLTTVDVSDPKANAEMTKKVLALSPYRVGISKKPTRAPKSGSNPIPSRLGEPSPIQHVLYIIKENRTYDQVFGDLKVNGKPYGNGDAHLTLFGETIAPNHRELARQYVLLDNFYATGDVSVDGHHWSNGAYVTDYMQRTWPQQYSGKGSPRLTEKLAETPNGRIWDQCRRAGISFASYYDGTQDHMSEGWKAVRDTGKRDYQLVDTFIEEFRRNEKAGTVPRFMIMGLGEDHTQGSRAGSFTPKACVASNDLGIGKIVEAISNSSLWSKFAIFIVEDDAQNGPDHVDAHRTVALAVSPYTYRRGIDSTHYSTLSMVRTMELILGLRPMSQFDASATPMYTAFRNGGLARPYRALTPAQDLQAKNAPSKPKPLLASIDFSEPDQLSLAQELALNEDIWQTVKGSTPYPGVVRGIALR